MKSGLSPVMGAILLIVLVIVIGTIVFLWTNKIFEKSGQPALEKKLCDSSNFVIGDFCYEEMMVENIETGEFEGRTHIKFSGRNDASKPELDGFMIFIDYDGRTISISSLMSSEIGGFDSKRITTDFIEDDLGIKQIRVVPKIREDSKVFICEEEEIVIDWEEVKPC